MMYTRRPLRLGAIVGALFALTVIMLPQVVVARTTEEVTQIASIEPGSDNNDEIVNVANETIEYNIDTWDPRPEGIFVGGTISESLIRLNEMASGDDAQMALASVVKLQREYVMSGASTFTVRLPVHIDEGNLPNQVNFAIYKLDTPDYSITRDTIYDYWTDAWTSRWDLNPYYPDTLDHTNCYKITPGTLLYAIWNVAHLNPTLRIPGYDPLGLSINPANDSYLSGNRIYAKVTAPLLPDFYYVLLTQIYYGEGDPFDVYLCPSDLCSDNVTDSEISYLYYPAPDQVIARNWPVSADLGYSFVFQTGLGGRAYEYNAWYDDGDILEWDTYLKIPGENVSGALNFMLEYRANATSNLTWRLGVAQEEGWMTALDDTWWNNKVSNSGYILASNPINKTYVATSIGGSNYVKFCCWLQILNATRIQVMTVYDPTWPASSNNLMHSSQSPDGAYYYTDKLSFGMWCTISIQNVSLNETAVINPGEDLGGFWDGIGNWWDKHWVDVLGAILIVAGVILICTGVGAGFGVLLIVAGIALILYNNHILDGLIQMIIDGLEWLGNWLWKIGAWIWEALTWLVEQIVYYGSIILGLLIILVAIFIFVVPVYFEIKILGAFLAMAQGDYREAAAQLGSVVSAGRTMMGRG